MFSVMRSVDKVMSMEKKTGEKEGLRCLVGETVNGSEGTMVSCSHGRQIGLLYLVWYHNNSALVMCYFGSAENAPSFRSVLRDS